MDQQSFQRAIALLSGEHSLSILRSLRDANWHLSSEVARSLDIHITTASKFLQRFAELGLVERR
ncbi:MAG: helix-turn-helix transcriptional regulator, partial [Methanobacteriota archaeon]